MTTAIAERPSRRDHAWHIRSVPATHLTREQSGGLFPGAMTRLPGTLCGKAGGPIWVPGVNPGTVWWCNECSKVWEQMWTDEE